jgi:MFS family permease
VPTPARRVRLILTLYPRRLRDRYGPEIADLLARSSRPRRDLLNVAAHALAERAGALGRRDWRPALGLLAAMAAVPAAVAAVAVAALAGLYIGLDPFLRDSQLVGPLFAALLAGGAGLGYAGVRVGARLRRRGAVALIPLGVGGWLLAAAFAPTLGVAVGEGPRARVIAIAGWTVGAVAVAAALAACRRAGRLRLAVVVATLGGLAVAWLPVIGYVLLALTAAEAPRHEAALWWWSTLDHRVLTADAPVVPLSLRGLPTLLALSTSTLLTLVWGAAGPGRPAAAPGRPAAEPTPEAGRG